MIHKNPQNYDITKTKHNKDIHILYKTKMKDVYYM